MKKGLGAALIGLGAGAVLFGAYYGALRFGVRIRPDFMLVGAAALAFASTVAVFALVSMERPALFGGRARLLLTEQPAVAYVFPFNSPDMVRITVKPEMSFGEIFARFDSALKKPPDDSKGIVLAIKGSRKLPLATITLQRIFLTLKPLRLEHVLLLGEKEKFIGYIPGKRATKEFTGNDAAEKITKYIVNVIDNPESCAVLRDVGGSPKPDTISESDDSRQAEAKIWANESVKGLVVHRDLQPVGYISKEDVLRLNAGRD